MTVILNCRFVMEKAANSIKYHTIPYQPLPPIEHSRPVVYLSVVPSILFENHKIQQNPILYHRQRQHYTTIIEK